MIKEKKLANGWKESTLGEVSEFINGRAFKPSEWEDEGKLIIRIQDLTGSISDPHYTKKKYHHKYLIKKGDLLISWSATLDAFIWNREDGWLNQHIFKVNENPLVIDKIFLFYLVRNKIDSIKKQTHGSTMKHITKKNFDSTKIPLPPLQTQKMIVAILEKAERLKEWRKEADELTDEFLKSTFLEMFGDPVTNPKKWDVKKLKDFGKIQTGNTPPRKNPDYYGEYIEWIKSDNINTPNTYLTASEEMLSENGVTVGRIVQKGSILVTCIAGSLSCIGNVAVADRVVAFNQQINAITPNEDVNELFLYHLILNTKNYIQNYSTQSMKGMISKSVFESIPFIYPPIDLQQKFTLVAKKVEQLREHQNQSRQQIDNLFNVLMQKAFRGELEA